MPLHLSVVRIAGPLMAVVLPTGLLLYGAAKWLVQKLVVRA